MGFWHVLLGIDPSGSSIVDTQGHVAISDAHTYTLKISDARLYTLAISDESTYTLTISDEGDPYG